MALRTLKVRAREGLVTRYDLISSGIRRMVGRKLVPNSEAGNGFAWEATGQTDEIPFLHEYVKAIRDGALWAADEATAKVAWPNDWRKKFDPSFGTAPAKPAAAPAPKPQAAAPAPVPAPAKEEVKK